MLHIHFSTRIRGKPGSGKSTFMKYIAQHRTTMDALEIWREGKKLLIGKFYFWNSGDELQRSQEGLLRSLLYGLLNNCRELAPVALAEALLPGKSEWPDFWTLDQLQQAWGALIKQMSINVKICLFIDGIDEYEGDDRVIAGVFERLMGQENIKVCLSSRPHPAFETSFGKRQSQVLRLEDLTLGDIRLYIKNQLASNSILRRMENHRPGLTKGLVDRISTKASGVFLWVRLVVGSFLDGLQDGDKRGDLEARLESLPRGLEALFQTILDRIMSPNQENPKHKVEALEQLSLVRWLKEKRSLTLLEFYFAESSLEVSEDENLAIPKSWTTAFLEMECEVLGKRVRSRCRGFLEVHESAGASPCNWRVTFLHTTLADFLDRTETKMNLDWPGPILLRRAFMQSTILKLKALARGGRDVSRPTWFNTVLPAVCEFLSWAAAQELQTRTADEYLCDELKCAADELWDKVSSRATRRRDVDSFHWAAVPRCLFAASGHTAPFNEPLDMSSFEKFAEKAGLDLYVAAKRRAKSRELLQFGNEGDSEREEDDDSVNEMEDENAGKW